MTFNEAKVVARLRIAGLTRAMLVQLVDEDGRFLPDRREEQIAHHVDRMMEVFGQTWGVRRAREVTLPIEPPWQRARVTAQGYPYSGLAFWVRGRPHTGGGPIANAWARHGKKKVVSYHPGRLFYETNLIRDEEPVYAVADAVELLRTFRRHVEPQVIDPRKSLARQQSPEPLESQEGVIA